MTKKRHFILLEILIAVALLSLCITPLITHPIRLYKKELKTLEELQIQRLKHEAFLAIKKQLFKNKIDWDSFSNKNREKVPIHEIKELEIEIDGFKNKERSLFS